MIIYILILLTFLAFLVIISWLLIKNKQLRWILGIISTVLLLLASVAVSANLANHWGMKEKTVSLNSQQIYTAGQTSSPKNLLIVEQVGNKSNNYVMVYRTNKNDSEATAHFAPNEKNIIDSVKKQASYKVADVDHATEETTKTYWVWKSKLYEDLFKLEDNDNELIKQETIVTVPEDSWIVLTSEQAKELENSK